MCRVNCPHTRFAKTAATVTQQTLTPLFERPIKTSSFVSKIVPKWKLWLCSWTFGMLPGHQLGVLAMSKYVVTMNAYWAILLTLYPVYTVNMLYFLKWSNQHPWVYWFAFQVHVAVFSIRPEPILAKDTTSPS